MGVLTRVRSWFSRAAPVVEAPLPVVEVEVSEPEPTRIIAFSKVIARESGVPPGCDKHNAPAAVVRAHTVSPM